jgi:potassium efflux system protein
LLRSFARHIVLCFWFALAFVTSAIAQGAVIDANGRPDYDAWEVVATRAEEALVSERASTEAFEVLRSNISSWRSAFITRQSANATRINTLKEQIAILGPAPTEGAIEPEEIASRRVELGQLLTQAQLPVLRAEEGFTRANGLVGEIDTLVRDRQTDKTLQLDPSPINPANWPDASRAVYGIGESVSREFTRNSNSATRVQSLKDNLPLTLFLLILGLVLVTRSSAWIERGVARLRDRSSESRASVRVATFVASVFGVILPLLGLIALLQAPLQSEFLGPVSSILFEVLAVWLATVFAARWLGREVFPRGYPPSPIVPLGAVHLKEGRTYATALGALIGFDIAGVAMGAEPLISRSWSEAAVPVLRFPVLALAGLMLFRMGQLLLLSRADKIAADDAPVPAVPEHLQDLDQPLGKVVVGFIARASMLIGILAPILVAIGYVTAGGMLLSSTVLTLGLLGVVAVLQRFMRDLFALIIGEDRTGTALIPVLVGFALVLLALPFLALIWGARIADLREVWGYVTTGFSIGDTRISISDFATFLVIFFIGYGVTRLVQGALHTQVLPKTSLDTGGRNAVVAGTGYIGIFLAALLAITGAGIDLSSLAIVAGALSVGIGFGLQTIVSNFVSGIILLIERPISEGDWIEVGTTMGVVRKIAVRATTIETFDRTEVIVPNADLIAGTVINWTKGNLTGRLILPVGVGYGTDTKRVETILREIAEAHPMVIVVPPPAVLFMNFGADALEFEIRAILRDVNYVMSARSEINHEIAKRFGEEGIEIPFAQRDLWLRNPEVLTPKATEA